jgi:LuxR family transcriptional regulator, maltose regulon positive regulatory protein
MPSTKNQKIAIRVFGAFIIERDGKPLDMEKLGYSKPVELLKFLIAYGGHNISTDFVISRLWSDSDGDHAKNSFDGTLYRLRNILGCKEALRLSSGVLSINQKICTLDLWEFETIAAEIENGLRPGAWIDAREYAHQLLAIVRGPCFWLASDASWAYTIQEKTKARFLRLVLGLGRALEKENAFDEAISLYGKALDHYPLAEEV